MSVRDTASADFLMRFLLGVWQTLIRMALVEWAPDDCTNLYGSGFDGTEIEYLDGKPAEEARAFLTDSIGDLYSLACRLGDRAPTPEDLGAAYVLSRQGAGSGFWDRGYGAEGDRLHEEARSLGDLGLMVSGSADDCGSWAVDVLQ